MSARIETHLELMYEYNGVRYIRYEENVIRGYKALSDDILDRETGTQDHSSIVYLWSEEEKETSDYFVDENLYYLSATGERGPQVI